MEIVVCKNRLIIRPHFPFHVFGKALDLDHDIPFGNITACSTLQGILGIRGLEVEFLDHAGEKHRVQFSSKDPARVRALCRVGG